jgi:ankyrin repeat protein
MKGYSEPKPMKTASPAVSPTHALFKAAFDGSVQELSQLLDKGVDPNVPFEHKDLGCWTPLHAACRTRHIVAVDKLLDAGATINAVDEYSATPLHVAAGIGDPAIVERLLSRGADVNAADEGQNTALHIACANGHAEVANLLIEAGADIGAVDEREDGTLHYAAAFCHDDVLALLLERGAVVNLRGEFLATALHHGCSEDQPTAVELLLYAGADPSLEDAYGRSPRDLAVTRNHIDCVRIIDRYLAGQAQLVNLERDFIGKLVQIRTGGDMLMEQEESPRKGRPVSGQAVQSPHGTEELQQDLQAQLDAALLRAQGLETALNDERERRRRSEEDAIVLQNTLDLKTELVCPGRCCTLWSE